MRQSLFPSALALCALTLVGLVGCEGQEPPPPVLTVTSPMRGLMQASGQITVTGTALPNANGDPVTGVTVNRVPATLGAGGAFTAVVDVPDGATLIETVATTEYGGKATDARAVQSGARQPVGANIDRAVTAALSADAFAKLSAAAGPLIKSLNLTALLAPQQPMANLGDSIANVQLSITQVTLGDVKISLTPTDGGLMFSADIDSLAMGAKATYAGTLVIDGTTTITATASHLTLSGTLVVAPAGTAGFTTRIASPKVQITALHLGANDLIGQVLQLVEDHLASTVQDVASRATEAGLEPLINDALGALGGPQQFTVLGKTLELQASPSALAFTAAGGLVSMDLQAKLAGSEGGPGFIYTPNGTPTMDPTHGVQLGVADDLLNEMLAEIYALGLLDLHLEQDFGLFDAIDIKLAMPPMVSADNQDGTLRLVLGDMIATVSDHGKPLVSAAINAQVDLAIDRGATPQQLALRFGKVDLWVNVQHDPATADAGGEFDISGAAASGLGIQLDSLGQFLVTLPLPSIAGVTLDSLAMHADSGYLVLSGEVH